MGRRGPVGAGGGTGSTGATGVTGPAGSYSTSTNRTITAASDSVLTSDARIYCNRPAGVMALALPAGAAAGLGYAFFFKDIGGEATAFPITITPNGAETIDGQPTLAISADYGAVTIEWTGAEWSIS